MNDPRFARVDAEHAAEAEENANGSTSVVPGKVTCPTLMLYGAKAGKQACMRGGWDLTPVRQSDVRRRTKTKIRKDATLAKPTDVRSTRSRRFANGETPPFDSSLRRPSSMS